MVLLYSAYWQDEIYITWGKFGWGGDSLDYSILSLWDESRHDWNIVDWDGKPQNSINPQVLVANFAFSTLQSTVLLGVKPWIVM